MPIMRLVLFWLLCISMITKSQCVVVFLTWTIIRVCVCGPTGEIHNKPYCHGQGYLHVPQGGAQNPLQRLHAGTGVLHRLAQRESPSDKTAAAGKSELLGYRESSALYGTRPRVLSRFTLFP